MWVNLAGANGAWTCGSSPTPGAVAAAPWLRASWQQYSRYARGDAQAGMHPDRHALRLAAYGGSAATLASGRRRPKALAAAGALAYAREPVRRAWRRMPDPRERAAAAVVVPALMGWIDTAKMAGYAVGLIDRGRRRS